MVLITQLKKTLKKQKKSLKLLSLKEDVSVEAEVGSIGGEEDGVVGKGEVADPKECKSIADLGVDYVSSWYRKHSR